MSAVIVAVAIVATATSAAPPADAARQSSVLSLSVETECRGSDAFLMASVTASADVADVILFEQFPVQGTGGIGHVRPPMPLELIGSMTAGQTSTYEYGFFEEGSSGSLSVGAQGVDTAGPVYVTMPVCGEPVVDTPTATGGDTTLPSPRRADPGLPPTL
jgi:hypothetical protein